MWRFVLIALIALPAKVAAAAIPPAVLENLKCTDANTVNCLRDNVFIIEGTADLRPAFGKNGKTVVVDDITSPNHYCKRGSTLDTHVVRWNCVLDNDKVVMKFLRILKDAGWSVDSNQWDQIAVFQIDTAEAGLNGGEGDPMLFFRVPSIGATLEGDPVNNGAFTGANDVDGIGIKQLRRNPNFPFVGYVSGGSTTTFGSVPSAPYGSWYPDDPGIFKPPTIKYWKDPDPAGGAYGFNTRFYRMCNLDALCWNSNPGFTSYQALAQATSSMYGPRLREEPELIGSNWFMFPSDQRSGCSPNDGPPHAPFVVPLDIACGPCAAGGEADAGVAADGGDPAPRNNPCPTGRCVVAGLMDPKPVFDGGTPINLSLRSGNRVAGTAMDPLEGGEPVLTVCPGAKANLAARVVPPSAPFDPDTGPLGEPPRRWNVNVLKTDPATNLPTATEYAAATTAGSLYYRIAPRIWNSFIDMDGSLMGGGANWSENGNGTASSGAPNPNQVASPPFRNTRINIFNPIELWLMGLLPSSIPDNPFDRIPPLMVYNIDATQVIGKIDGTGRFTDTAGPRMGIATENVVIRSVGHSVSVPFEQLLDPAGTAPPKRTPDFTSAPHFLRQAWILVTKPEDRIPAIDNVDCNAKLTACHDDQGAFPGDPDCDIVRSQVEKARAAGGGTVDLKTVDKLIGCLTVTNDDGTASTQAERLARINKRHIDLMTRWRKAWQQHYYMLTSYRGRMVSNFEGTYDDSAYWEFLQKTDDEKTFVPGGGLVMAVSGAHKDPNSPAILSFANVSTPGSAGVMSFASHSNQLPLRIDSRQDVMGNTNAVLVRMRVPRIDDRSKWPKSHAEIRLRTEAGAGPAIHIPSRTNAFLAYDGQYHTYTAQLWADRDTDDQEQQDLARRFGTGAIYTGFDFAPSSTKMECGDVRNLDDPACLKVEYIRFMSVDDREAAADLDLACDSQRKPDGFIGLEDNCPWLYNPDQADADGNGIGDDCEDDDRDDVANGCDNCRTTVNGLQVDSDRDGLGDTCDAGKQGGCVLGGQVSKGGSGASLALGGLALAGAFVLLRLRRRK